MQDLEFSLNIVLPILLLILTGMALSRLKLVNTGFVDTANKISFNAFLPVLLFYSIASSDFKTVFDGRLIAFILGAAVILFVMLIIFVPLIVKDNARKSVIIQGLFRSNFIIFGIPICEGIAGEAGKAVAAMVSAFLVPMYNILMVIVLDYYSEGEKHNAWYYVKKITKNPFIIAGLFAVAYIILDSIIPWFGMPEAINDFLEYISNMATPLALILLGADFSGKSALRNIKVVTVVGLLKTMLIPLIAVAIAMRMGFQDIQLAVILTAFGAPAAVTGYVMAKNVKADYNLAGEIIVGTTLFCIFTMFVFIYLGKMFGII